MEVIAIPQSDLNFVRLCKKSPLQKDANDGSHVFYGTNQDHLGFWTHQTFVYICWIPVWVAGAFAFRGITTVGALQQDSTLCQHQCTWPWSNVKGKPEVIWKDSYSYIPIGDSSIGMSKNHLKSWQTIRTRWLPTCCSDWSFHAHCETKRRRREIRRQTGRQEWTSWPCCCWAAGVMQLSIYKLFIRVLGVVFNIVCDLLAVNSF